MYTINKNIITIKNDEPFDARKIIESGQIFRYEMHENECHIFSGDKKCSLLNSNSGTKIITEKNNLDYFINYFDLHRSYAKINVELAKIKSKKLKAAVDFGTGIRILRQDKYETLISFLLSSNNNIIRIQKILKQLCSELGRKKENYYTFPAPAVMAKQSEQFYLDIGCGYRSKWLLEAAQQIDKNIDLEACAALTTEELLIKLRQFNGVGPKVADCIALFAYNRGDVFPIDTWIKKAYADFFKASPAEQVMRKKLLECFGKNAGIAQQYIFYYYRNRL